MRNKIIWNISSLISTINSPNFHMEEYRLQKQTLDQAHYNLKQRSKCRFLLIRPGKVDTQGEGGARLGQENTGARKSAG